MTVAPGQHAGLSRDDVPPSPHGLTVTGDYTGLTVSWGQRGPVDGWTVYCDPLDGSDTESVFIPQRSDRDPGYRFGDLAPGEHHVGVVSWRSGRPSRGAGCWTYASVFDQPANGPCIPVVTELAVTADTMTMSWISQDVAHWHVRLLGSDHSLCQELDVVDRPHVVLDGLIPDARYGIQVRAVSEDSTPSPWCEPTWTRTGPLTRSGLS